MSYDEIRNMDELNLAIRKAEEDQSIKYRNMKNHFGVMVEGLRVKNLLKDAVADFKSDNEVPGSILNSASAMAAGYASKKLFEAGSSNRIRKLLGTALMFGVSKWISGNPEIVNSIRDRVGGFIQQFGKARKDDSSESIT
jgi:hypothetical protein